MPSFCVVLNCNDKYGHADDISFHKFPFKRKELMTKWLEYAQRGSDWKPSKWSSICSRHFSDENFSCLNERRTLKKSAIPSVALRTVEEKLSATADNGKVSVKVVKETAQLQSRSINDSESNKVIEEPKKPNGSKRLCRLCGCATSDAVTFASNFEVFGMIQKCLPVLNIQQDNNLPKEVCRVCLQRLESFGRFIDGVLDAQSTLQRQFSTEKPSNSATRTAEKPLKIKQEPVVRVKQEAAEVDDSFLSDEMDITMADDNFGGDQEQQDATRDIERKFNFGDFPALNTQDIINNCDIMEIINLDDPFINIPDDDGNVASPITEPDAYVASQKPEFPSPHELLQAHLIMEEHSYANAAEDLKEEWQIKNSCKTEKNDGYELRGTADNATHTEQEGEESYFQQNYELSALLPIAATTAITPTITTHVDEHNQRSTRPIVTSVSAFADTHPQARRPHSKPNIVVLNESIVQSTSAFQLHACTDCQLRFFSVDSLHQHSMSMHSGGGIPMVSVPHMNIQPEQQQQQWPSLATESVAPPTTCKVEKGCEKELPPSSFCVNPQISTVETDLSRSYGGHTNISNNTCNWQNYASGAYAATSQQQHFITAEPLNNHAHNPFGQMMLREQPTHTSGDVEYPQLESHMYLMPMAAASADGEHESVLLKLPQTGSATSKRMRNRIGISDCGYEANHQRYVQLQRRYHRLHRKFLKARAKRKKHRCHLCSRVYQSVAQLLRHKQTRSHFVSKPRHFAANCLGCEKFFRSRLALRNHMRYICQQLRWCMTHLQTFKCRHCRLITFTHWRLYRQHEDKCKAKQGRLRYRQRQQRPRQRDLFKEKKEVPATASAVISAFEISGQAKPSKKRSPRKQSSRICTLCAKVFSSAAAFKQHTITHTIGRDIKCSLCDRVFKRRNGLMQHLRSFHLQIRPHECPVCQHRFALKCDMKRCKHSKLRHPAKILTYTSTPPIATIVP